MTKTEQYKRILLEKNPNLVNYPENAVTLEQALIGIMLQQSLCIEKLEKQIGEVIKALRVLATGGGVAPVAAGEAPVDAAAEGEKPIEEMTEEEVKELARKPSAGGGPAMNARPAAQPAAPIPNRQAPPSNGPSQAS